MMAEVTAGVEERNGHLDQRQPRASPSCPSAPPPPPPPMGYPLANRVLILTMLISASGDVPGGDLQTVADTVSRWNFIVGVRMHQTAGARAAWMRP